MHYKHPAGLHDLDLIKLALANNPVATAALHRIWNDLDVFAESLDIYGRHLSGRGCATKKHPDAYQLRAGQAPRTSWSRANAIRYPKMAPGPTRRGDR
jgi:hypothetical protein